MILPLHGVGGAADLPIPRSLAIAGAVAALTVSFTVLALAWREPRYDGRLRGRPAPAWLAGLADSTWFLVLLRAVGLVAFGYVAWAALAGPDLATNPTFGVVYVLLWVGLVPLSLLFGPVWWAISPLRSVLALVGPVGRPRELPAWVGLWPAAFGLLAFTWLELVSPDAGSLSAVRWWFGIWGVVLLVGGLVFGSSFLSAADPFEVWSSLVARLSPWGRDDRGRLVLRSPLDNLATVEPTPGLVAVVAVLFGGTAFDSFSASSRWLRFSQTSPYAGTTTDTLVLLTLVLFVGVVFTAACRWPTPRPTHDRRDLAALLAHSMVPIIVGYLYAHYVTLLVQVGMQTLVQLSDPMGTGANLLGTADWSVSYWLTYHPTFLAVTKVLAVVLGHVLGVVAAHDRSMSLLARRDQLTGQLPLLFAMVGFTAGGLYLLFSA